MTTLTPRAETVSAVKPVCYAPTVAVLATPERTSSSVLLSGASPDRPGAPSTSGPGPEFCMDTPRGSKQRGKRNSNWKGGRTVASNGYVLVKCAGHPLADVRGYVYEHRLVACLIVGRIIERSTHVHHINHDTTDNRPENLEVVTAAEHGVRHRGPGCNRRLPKEPSPTVTCQCGCGAKFSRYDKWKRPRRFVSGHNLREAS